jgi:hypothetical protein
MDKHNYNDNDIFYRQKFDNYEVDLPSGDWDVFSRKLAEAQPKRRRFVWYYVAAAASVAGVILLGSSLLNKQDKPTGPVFARQETTLSKHPQKTLLANNAVIETATVTTKNRVGTSVTTVPISRQANTVQGIQPGTNNEGGAGNAEIREISVTTSAASLASTGSTSAPQAVIAQKEVVTEQFDTTGYITHPVPHYAELPALPTAQGGDSEKSNKSNSKGANNMVKWLAGTFQGNLSLSSGAGNNMTSDGSIGYQLFSRVSQAESLSGSSSSNLISFSGKKTHYVPLSFGLSFGTPLSKRWELQSGLVYTLLITTGELGAQYSGGTKSTGRIEQHYLGIPLSLSYSFICKPSFSVYLIGGGRIEKGISLVEKIYTYDTQNTPIEQERYHYSIKGVQLSLDAGVGASYRLYRFIHWYVETGGAWYVPGNQPESARTEHPLNVSFKTGLKFSLSKQ